jgi:hypothetical protein
MLSMFDTGLVRWARNALIGLLLIGQAADMRAQSQTAAGVRAQAVNVQSEAAGGGVINVTYDLESPDPNAVFSIVLEVSQDGGKTFGVKAASVSGDVGPNVRPGRGKRIVWQAGNDIETVQLDQLRFNIRPAAGRPVGNARLTINSNPPGAVVRVDGTERGQTPLTLTDLTAATHEIVLTREGYLENKRSVAVRAGEENSVTVDLTAAAADKTPAPAQGGGGGVSPLVWVGVAGGGAAAVAVALAGGSNPPPPPTTTTTAPATCQFAVSGNIGTVSSSGGSLTITVVGTPNPCAGSWSSTTNVPWISINPNTGSGAGNTTVTISIQANTGAAPRTGTLTVAGQAFEVTQSGAQPACTVTAAFFNGQTQPPSNNTSVPGNCDPGPGCGERDIDIAASPNNSSCTWQVSNQPGFFQVFSGPTSGAGSTRIRMRVTQRNGTGADRTANFQIGNSTLTVRQCAGTCQ